MKQINLINFCIASLINVIFGLSVSGQPSDSLAVYGYIEDSQDFWNNVPNLILSQESQSKQLPSEVNNSDYIYFPRYIDPLTGDTNKYIYIQQGTGSCAAVSTVFYTFAYEINRVREVSGLTDENKYPPNFTWNFLNDGVGSAGSSFEGNLQIIRDYGVANGEDWGNFDPHDTLRWMSGYEKYHHAHFNRIDKFYKIYPLSDPDTFLILKHWIADHNEGDSIGGVAVFGTNKVVGDEDYLPDSSAHAGELAQINWKSGNGHAMTIVGYCDDILYDFNKDSLFTDSIDLNNDGIIDVRDCEIGAFNVVGRGSATYGQDGFVWIPYKTMAEIPTSFGHPYVYVMKVKEDHEPKLEVKVKIKHDNRESYGAKYSWAENANQTIPTSSPAYVNDVFWFNGGDHPLHGIDSNSVETGFDISYWIEEEDFGKIFFRPYEIGSIYYNGIVEYMSIIDYRWDEEFELFSDVTNVPIPHGGTQNNIFVNYDLIPHENNITSNLIFDSDMVSRFNPTVSNGATLTVDDGVQIDMYESELEITSTASLVIDDNATFTAKKGTCKITIDGTVSIGSDVSFLAEDNAQLQLVLNNTGLTLAISDCNFDGAAIISYIDDLTISNSDFTNGGISLRSTSVSYLLP